MRLDLLASSVVLVSASLAAHADSSNFTVGNSSTSWSGSGVLTTGKAVAVTPEPYSFILLGTGLLAVAGMVTPRHDGDTPKSTPCRTWLAL